jgi:hypothetical protein
MAQMKAIWQRAHDICEFCGSKNSCNECTITVKHEGKRVILDGETKQIIAVGTPMK